MLWFGKMALIFFYNIKVSETILGFTDIGIEICGFHSSKYLIDIDKVNIKKIVTSKKFCFSEKAFKYFIGLKCGTKLSHYV